MRAEAAPRRLLLHVGMHKTGTSWIQAVLAHNRATLMAHGIGYPDLGGGRGPWAPDFGMNHGWPLVRLAAGDAPDSRFGGIGTPAAVAGTPQARTRALRALKDALDDRDLRLVVLSGEQLSNVLRAPEAVRLAELLHRPDLSVRVLAYVREPVSFAVSMAQQRLRAGGTRHEVCERPPLPAYRRRLGKFLKAFGHDDVEIRVYDRRRFSRGDVMRDFLEATGEADLLEILDRPPRRRGNPAMSRAAARLLDARNRALEALSPGLAERHPPRALRLFERWLPGSPFDLPETAKAQVRARSRADVEWLAGRLGAPPFDER